MLVYVSLVFSFASAAQYVRLFGNAVEAKEKKLAASGEARGSRRDVNDADGDDT